jgi:hypothetical protein
MHTGYWSGSQKVRDHWEDLDVGGWTILKWILRERGWDGIEWIDLAHDKRPVEGSHEHNNEPSGSIKCLEFLEWLHNWQLLKKGSTP